MNKSIQPIDGPLLRVSDLSDMFGLILSRLYGGRFSATVRIGYGTGSMEGALMFIHTDISVLTCSPMLKDWSHDDVWAMLLHEAGHLEFPHDGGPKDDGHGPRWTKSVGDRGITVEAERDAKDGLLYFSHEIITNGKLDKIRRDWLSKRGLSVNPPRHAQNMDSVASHPTNTGSGGHRGGAVPQITRNTVPSSARNILIIADCSASMEISGGDGSGRRIDALMNALEKVWPIAGAKLFALGDQVREVQSPRQLQIGLAGGGTSVVAAVELAAKLRPDILLLFADGWFGDDHKVWDIWRRTSFPIATHMCVSAALASRGEHDVEVMRRLCRGGGQFAAGDTARLMGESLQSATHVPEKAIGGRRMPEPTPTRAPAAPVTQATRQLVTYNATARQLPDLSAEVQRMIAAAQTQLETSTHFADMSARLNDVAHEMRAMKGEQTILKAAAALTAVIAGHTNQALAHHSAQYQADEAHGNQALAQLAEGMSALVNMLGGVSKEHHGGMLLSQAQRSATLDATSTTIQIGDFSLDQGVFDRASALLGSRQGSAPSLPPVERRVAISAPLSEQRQTAREMVPVQSGRRRNGW